MTGHRTPARQRVDKANATRMELTERLVNRGVPLAVAVDIVHTAWWAGWNNGYDVCQESRNRS